MGCGASAARRSVRTNQNSVHSAEDAFARQDAHEMLFIQEESYCEAALHLQSVFRRHRVRKRLVFHISTLVSRMYVDTALRNIRELAASRIAVAVISRVLTRQIQNSAAICIQGMLRHSIIRKTVRARLGVLFSRRWVTTACQNVSEIEAAIVLQRHSRACIARRIGLACVVRVMCGSYLEIGNGTVRIIKDKAARSLQKHFRSYHARQSVREQLVVMRCNECVAHAEERAMAIRINSSLYIQKHIRRHQALRQLIDELALGLCQQCIQAGNLMVMQLKSVELGHTRLRIKHQYNAVKQQAETTANHAPYTLKSYPVPAPPPPSPHSSQRPQALANVSAPQLDSGRSTFASTFCVEHDAKCDTSQNRSSLFHEDPCQPLPENDCSNEMPQDGSMEVARVLLGRTQTETFKRRPGRVVCPFMEISAQGISSLLNACSLDAADCVYDIGCGKGNITAEFLDCFPCRAVGVEINMTLARHARQRLEKYGERVHVLVEDVCRLDLSDATVVVSFFISNALQKVSSHMAASLRPGCIWLNYGWPVPGWSTSRPASDGVYTYVIGTELWEGFENFRGEVTQDSVSKVMLNFVGSQSSESIGHKAQTVSRPWMPMSKSHAARSKPAHSHRMLRPLHHTIPPSMQ